MSSSTSVFNQPKPVVKLDHALLDKIVSGVQPYPIPEGRVYGYGTAGVSATIFTGDDFADKGPSSV